MTRELKNGIDLKKYNTTGNSCGCSDFSYRGGSHYTIIDGIETAVCKHIKAWHENGNISKEDKEDQNVLATIDQLFPVANTTNYNKQKEDQMENNLNELANQYRRINRELSLLNDEKKLIQEAIKETLGDRETESLKLPDGSLCSLVYKSAFRKSFDYKNAIKNGDLSQDLYDNYLVEKEYKTLKINFK